MKFSIIVPVYKVEQYLDRCVRSLLNQTDTDIEVILVDDGSPDSCPLMCDDYARKDKRVKVIHKENGGLSDARNAGVKAATGEYVIFVDSDDYISHDACEKLKPYAETGCDILIADATVEGLDLDLSHIEIEGVVSGFDYLRKAVSAGKIPMAAWLNIYKRSFLIDQKIEFKRGILHEDEQFTPRAILQAKTVVITGVDFYHYIIRRDSITTKSDKRKNAEDFYLTCCELEQIYKKIEDKELSDNLLDLLVRKYLSLFYSGNIFRYGKKYYHRLFMIRNAKTARTRCKVALYCISPRLYCRVNRGTKG